ncbi:MAG: T9SS type A sorting domain-containing protein [Bacteroidetes bacterium]|nr:T9SS type A sorting domain-containing protein [Bacteroidota bacterium]
MHKYLLPLFCGLLLSGVLQAQCPTGQKNVRLEISPDQYWYEVSWKLTNANGSVTYASGQLPGQVLSTYNYCVPDNACVVFRIKDSYGDGMLPNGYYRLYINDTLFYENPNGDYGDGENIFFNCPPGTYCDAAVPVDTGLTVAPAGGEYWYHFVPEVNGTYEVSTCLPGNNCPSKIWVYDHCSNISTNNDQTGTIFYADAGCTNGAVATLYLAAGSNYYIRLGYTGGNCSNDPLNFHLGYVGPVSGCTDPLACNYNPLATVSDTCIYPGNPDCPNAPDLVVLENVLRNSLQLDFLANADACAVEEGCIRGVGNRDILRFSTHIKNIGNQDYYIGSPPSNQNTPSTQFYWDPCHNHWHYRGYAEYLLYDENGSRLSIGTKNGFCVLDLECNDGGTGQYGCGNMGISVGCGDIYGSGLPCQWVDITDLPAGTYTLVVRVNWDKSPDKLGRLEKTYDNNWAQACFNLSYAGNNPVVDFLDEVCPVYTDCTGETYGSAQPDCDGICNGVSVRGDWNHDTLRTVVDVQAYLSAALADNETATECRDLHPNGNIDVYDAALLQECTLYAEDLDHWGLGFPCQFGGFENTEDVVYLLPGTLDTVGKTFDVEIVNPYNAVIGYEFSVSGLNINYVENISGTMTASVQHDNTGEIIALSGDETSIKKNVLPTPFVRVHYSELTSPEVCISQITAVVNSKYQKSGAQIASPSCVSTGVVGSHEPNDLGFSVFVQPNPFREDVTIFFNNQNAEPFKVTLSDMTGRILRSYDNIKSEYVTFQRGDLPDGVYMYTVSNSKGQVSGKIAAH